MNDDADSNNDRRHTTAMEGRVQTILQALVLGGVLWLAASVITLKEAAIRVEERALTNTASSARIESDIGALKAQLAVIDKAYQQLIFKQDDFDRRLKGMELYRDKQR